MSQTHRTVNRRTGEVRTVEVLPPSHRLDAEPGGLDEHAARLVKDREAREDAGKLAAWLASPEADKRPGYGLAGKAVLPDGPRTPNGRDALRTTGIGGRKAAQSRQGISAGAVDLSTVSRKAPVERPSATPENVKMSALFVRTAQAITTAYPSECGAIRADIKELASYYRHDVARLAQLSKLDDHAKRIQYNVPR